MLVLKKCKRLDWKKYLSELKCKKEILFYIIIYTLFSLHTIKDFMLYFLVYFIWILKTTTISIVIFLCVNEIFVNVRKENIFYFSYILYLIVISNSLEVPLDLERIWEISTTNKQIDEQANKQKIFTNKN